MKVTAERIPESKVLLRIEIPPEQVEKAIERSYRDLARRVKIPGFRPGKAPRNIVERYVGSRDTIQQEGIDRLIDESYRKALVETDTHPVGEPDILERPEFKSGEPLVIEASVPVAPTVELGDYRSIRMPPVQVEATPEQINNFIDALRERNAEWVAVERPIQNGDQAKIDVLGVAGSVPTLYGPTGETILQTSGGQEVYNVTDHEHLVNVEGPAEFAPGFDEELIGVRAGDEKRFGLTLPADYPDQNLANQSVVFTVKVHEVKEKHLPELDDEFAKKVEGGETMEDLRAHARDLLQRRMESEARQAYENALLTAAVERSTVEVPDVMIHRQIDSEVEELKTDLGRQKVTWPQYLQSIQRSEEALRADLHEPAARSLRSYLVLREIARREGIEVAPEEVNAEIEATASQFGRAASIVRERLSTRDERENIEGRILHRKVMARLAQIAQQPPEGGAGGEAPEPGAETAGEAVGARGEGPAEAADAGPVEEPPLDLAPTAPAEVALGPEPPSEAPTTEEPTSHG